jgi:hypothetical protein
MALQSDRWLWSSKSALDIHEVSHENFDKDANVQSKQGLEPEIGKENQKGPES